MWSYKTVNYLGHGMSADGVSVGTDLCQRLSFSVKSSGFHTMFYAIFWREDRTTRRSRKKDYASRTRFYIAWGDAQKSIFAHVERLLIAAPVLNFPNFERGLVVTLMKVMHVEERC